VFAEVDCGSNIPLRTVYIHDFQGTSFCHATSGVEANPKECAIAMSLQTLVKQQFDFGLSEYFGLSVSLNFHAWCIPDPTKRKSGILVTLLHQSEGFLNAAMAGDRHKLAEQCQRGKENRIAFDVTHN